MKNRSLARRGISMVYALILMGVLFAFCSLAVDWGRVQLAKTQLRAAADSASRFAAMMLPNGSSATIAAAIDAADDNNADGSPVILNAAQDVEIGYWDSNLKTFTKLTGSAQANANAVRVIARRIAARNNAVPTVFAQILGRASCDVTAELISMLNAPQVIDTDVPATATPYLAGMPTGTISSPNNPETSGDRSPYQSPPTVDLTLKPGEALTFDNIAGGANNNITWDARYQPDGNTGWMVDNWTGNNTGNQWLPEHGKSDMEAPINALVGVFLTDAVPTNAGAPEKLSFRYASERDFSELKPKIGQVFFIGDGKRDNGQAQRFIVPQGATRFYLANWDGYNWGNNVGLRTTRTTRLGSVVTVK